MNATSGHFGEAPWHEMDQVMRGIQPQPTWVAPSPQIWTWSPQVIRDFPKISMWCSWRSITGCSITVGIWYFQWLRTTKCFAARDHRWVTKGRIVIDNDLQTAVLYSQLKVALQSVHNTSTLQLIQVILKCSHSPSSAHHNPGDPADWPLGEARRTTDLSLVSLESQFCPFQEPAKHTDFSNFSAPIGKSLSSLSDSSCSEILGWISWTLGYAQWHDSEISHRPWTIINHKPNHS